MTTTTEAIPCATPPELLFEAELVPTTSASANAAVDSAGQQDGDLIHSGEGTVRGSRIRGRIRWSFYARDCVYLLVRSGATPPPGRHLCYTHPTGSIETDDGASIRFDARGYGLRGYDPHHPERWRLSMGLQFQTDDPRYQWLNSTLALWEGRFDEKAQVARYRAFVETEAAAPAALR